MAPLDYVAADTGSIPCFCNCTPIPRFLLAQCVSNAGRNLAQTTPMVTAYTLPNNILYTQQQVAQPSKSQIRKFLCVVHINYLGL
jgi:hypothetical protein